LSHGCDAEIATNGLQCLERLEATDPTVVVIDPSLQWGGGDGVLDWLIHERPELQPMVVVADTPGTDSVSRQLRPWIDLQVRRPESLQELAQFVSQIEAVASWSILPYRDATNVQAQMGECPSNN
jgi:DNA-binding NarL/FixJ family response regulator